ncbi:MAG: ChrR family anti-sigma-E factor [Pseudolabrys sp.]
MTIHHHPSDETLTAYAGGSLDTARRLVVASHLERCAACRTFVAGAERIAGVMMEDMQPAAMSADALHHTLARLDVASTNAAVAPIADEQWERGLPPSLRGYELGSWRWVGPGVQMRSVLLPGDEATRLFLLKGAPGTRLPQHSHSGVELTSILAGSYRHEGGNFAAGDFEEADEGVEHRPIVGGDQQCICLVALEGRLRLSGLMGALLNPFVRL